MLLIFMTVSFRKPNIIQIQDGEIKRINKRLYDGCFIPIDITSRDIKTNIKKIVKKNKGDTYIVAISSCIYNYNEETDIITEVGHFLALDFDYCDFASTLNMARYIKEKYKLNGDFIIVKTGKGHHIYIFNLLPFSIVREIINDEIISQFEDKDHIKISSEQGYLAIRIDRTKYGADNPLEIVYEETNNENNNTIEKEIKNAIKRILKYDIIIE